MTDHDRANLLVTFGMTAAYLQNSGDIDVPGEFEFDKEDAVTELAIEWVNFYEVMRKYSDIIPYLDQPYDVMIEQLMLGKWGKKKEEKANDRA